MQTNSQLKTFCLHLAAQISSQEELTIQQFAEELVTAANIFEAYLLVEPDEEGETAPSVESDYMKEEAANIVLFPGQDNDDDGGVS